MNITPFTANNHVGNIHHSTNSQSAKPARLYTVAQLLHASNTPKISSQSLIRFPTENRVSKSKWICNISEELKFIDKHPHFLQINPNTTHNQFSILRKLLLANTCQIIYFDANFSEEELQEIRALQSASKTELVNAKLAYKLSISAAS